MKPRRTARITGVLYLMTIVGGVIAQAFISNRLISFSDAATTANNILAHQSLFQSGLTIYLIEMTCQIAMTALFYVLLKPVSRTIALVSTVIGLSGCIIKTAARLFYIAPVFVLGSHSLTAFTPTQLHAISLVLLKINDQGAGIALAFMGVGAFLKGYLIFRSTFLPRFLGVLSMIGSAGWLTFLYLPLGYASFNIVAPLALLASIVEIFWLIVFGVDEDRWRALT
jgi:hypothetical protein